MMRLMIKMDPGNLKMPCIIWQHCLDIQTSIFSEYFGQLIHHLSSDEIYDKYKMSLTFVMD